MWMANSQAPANVPEVSKYHKGMRAAGSPKVLTENAIPALDMTQPHPHDECAIHFRFLADRRQWPLARLWLVEAGYAALPAQDIRYKGAER